MGYQKLNHHPFLIPARPQAAVAEVLLTFLDIFVCPSQAKACPCNALQNS